ncbi:hypothetical protein BJX99DRAFT_139248 [Aspergillus californicus]
MQFTKTAIFTILAATGALATPTGQPPLQKRDISCADNGGGTVDVGDATNCYNFLLGRGSETCAIDGETTVFCTSGTAVIGGSNIGGGSASSLCSDIASAVGALIGYCPTAGQIAGYAPANGNGNIIVSIEHS